MSPEARSWSVAVLAAVLAAVVATAAVLFHHHADPPAFAAGGAALVPDGPGRRAVVWAVGDGPDGRADARAVAGLIASGAPDRVLHLGDVYGGARSGRAYRDRFEPSWGALAKITAPTPGNHDWPAGAGAGYLTFWGEQYGRTPPPYYTFRLAGWQLLSLDSETAHDARSAQVGWLRRQVSGPGDCRLAFWHRPRYSDGRHGDQGDIAPLWDTLRGHAALVLNAHDHDMQLLEPIDGITEVVSGAGGHSHYPIRRDDRLVFGDDGHFGAVRLTLRPGRADIDFVAVGGRVLHRSTVGCSPR